MTRRISLLCLIGFFSTSSPALAEVVGGSINTGRQETCVVESGRRGVGTYCVSLQGSDHVTSGKKRDGRLYIVDPSGDVATQTRGFRGTRHVYIARDRGADKVIYLNHAGAIIGGHGLSTWEMSIVAWRQGVSSLIATIGALDEEEQWELYENVALAAKTVGKYRWLRADQRRRITDVIVRMNGSKTSHALVSAILGATSHAAQPYTRHLKRLVTPGKSTSAVVFPGLSTIVASGGNGGGGRPGPASCIFCSGGNGGGGRPGPALGKIATGGNGGFPGNPYASGGNGGGGRPGPAQKGWVLQGWSADADRVDLPEIPLDNVETRGTYLFISQ
jgi:hypothetical protein